MELKHVEAFLKVVETGSFSTASNALYISQPTISLRIQKLEQELDTVLFKRNGGKKAVLTEEGEKIYPFYKEGYQWIAKGNEALLSDKEEKRKVRLSCPTHMGQFILPKIVKSLYTHFPDIDLNVKVSKTDLILEDIKKGATDVGLIFLHSKESNELYTIIPIAMEQTVLIASPNHPLANRTRIEIADLAEEQFIVFAKASNKHIIVDRFFAEYGLTTYKTIEIKNLEWIKSMVKSGIGISFLQKNIVETELESLELVQLSLAQPLPDTPISIIFRKNVREEIQRNITETMKELYRA